MMIFISCFTSKKKKEKKTVCASWWQQLYTQAHYLSFHFSFSHFICKLFFHLFVCLFICLFVLRSENANAVRAREWSCGCEKGGRMGREVVGRGRGCQEQIYMARKCFCGHFSSNIHRVYVTLNDCVILL